MTYLNQQLQLAVIKEVNLAQAALCHLEGRNKDNSCKTTPEHLTVSTSTCASQLKAVRPLFQASFQALFSVTIGFVMKE